MYGFDPSERLALGGARRNMPDGSEDNIRLPNGTLHRLTGHFEYKWKMAIKTKVIDGQMREHRQTFAVQPGPREESMSDYANHILKYFDAAIERYTKYGYALQRFLYRRQTNQALEAIATQYIGGEETVVFVGDKMLPSNSPAKGYIRTKNRLLIKKMKQRCLCTVIKVDEKRTTMLCSRCGYILEHAKKRGRFQPCYRYKVCRNCRPNSQFQPLARRRIWSKKPNRRLTRDRLEARLARIPSVVEENAPPTALTSKFYRYEVRQPDAMEQELGRTITLNRDINAGRNIMQISKKKEN